MKEYRSFRKRLFVYLMLFATVPMLIGSVFFYYQAIHAEKNAIFENLNFSLKQISVETASFYRDVELHLSQFQNSGFAPFYNSILNSSRTPDQLIEFIQSITDKYPRKNFVILKKHKYFNRCTILNDTTYSDHRLISYLEQNDFSNERFTPFFPGNPVSQYYVVPLYSGSEEFLFLAFRILPCNLRYLLHKLPFDSAKVFFMMSSSGNLIFSTPDIFHEIQVGEWLQNEEKVRLGGKDYFVLSTNLPRYKISLHVVTPVDEVHESMEEIRNHYMIFLVAVLLIMITGGFFVSKREALPLQELVNYVTDIVKGKFDRMVFIRTGDERELLAREITELKNALEHYSQLMENEILLRKQELVKAKRQIQHQEKMANLGMLAAGVAHEIGNPLTSISNLAQLLLRKCHDEKDRGYLELMRKNIERISEIVNDLVNFSRPSQEKFAMVNINSVVEQALKIVKFDRKGKRIKFVSMLDTEIEPIYIIEGQLLQVLINLLMNAIDAVGVGDGIITVATSRDGKFIKISVSDNGVGIPEEIADKIFEPFFTTKEPGKGTGLGLAVSYSIVKNFGGEILVNSKIGEGSQFDVYLPIVTEEKIVDERQNSYSR